MSTSAQNGATSWPLVGKSCGRDVSEGVLLNEISPSLEIYEERFNIITYWIS